MKYVLVIMAALSLGGCMPGTPAPGPVGDSSQTALDWAGRYTGTLPCADCSGIETALELQAGGAYVLSETYIGRGKPFLSKGHFAWASDGGSIVLDAAGDGRRYKVGEGRLWQLDTEGQMITGNLASAYVLTKSN